MLQVLALCSILLGVRSSESRQANVSQVAVSTNLAGFRVFPSDNPWNRDVSMEPVDPDSERIIARIGLDKPLHPDFGPSPESGIPYIVVSGSQAKVPVTFAYPDES